ncbi:MAG: hypothetical protein PIR02_12235 [Microbacterium enclense]
MTDVGYIVPMGAAEARALLLARNWHTAHVSTDYSRYLVDYYANGENIHQDEYAKIPPVIGHGFEFGGKWYRIVDVWTVHEKHAPVTHGTAVFLEEVETPQVFLDVDSRYYG